MHASRVVWAVLLCAWTCQAGAADFSATSSLPAPKEGHALIASGGFLYNIGGMGALNGIAEGDQVYYAPILRGGEVGGWTTAAPLPEAVMFHCGVSWKGVLYVLGGNHYGADGVAVSNVVYYSKIGSGGAPGAWNRASPLPETLFLQSAVVWNGVIYVTGGWGNQSLTGGVYSSVIQPDGSLGEWRALNSLPSPVYGHAAVENGAIYVIGGAVNNGEVITNQVLYAVINQDGSIGDWHEANPLPTPVINPAAAVVGGRIFVAGGWIGDRAVRDVNSAVSRADGSLELWGPGPALPEPLYYHAAAVSDGAMYVSGGSDGSSIRDGVYFIQLTSPPPPPSEEDPPQALKVSVDFHPNTLNLMSNGRYVGMSLQSGAGLSSSQIDPASVRIVAVNGRAVSPLAALSHPPAALGDENGDGVSDLRVKFDRSALQAVLGAGDNALDISGSLSDGRAFSGAGTIWGLKPEKQVRLVKNCRHPSHAGGKHALQVLASQGGQLALEGGYNASIEIPPGALRKAVAVSMMYDAPASAAELKRRRDASADASLTAAGSPVTFGPEGTHFDAPVAITLAYDSSVLPDGDAERLAVHYFNPGSGKWEKLASRIDENNGVVTAETNHFSLYQVMYEAPAAPAPAPAAQAPAAEELSIAEEASVANEVPAAAGTPAFRGARGLSGVSTPGAAAPAPAPAALASVFEELSLDAARTPAVPGAAQEFIFVTRRGATAEEPASQEELLPADARRSRGVSSGAAKTQALESRGVALADAKFNFLTIVGNYIAQASSKGLWALKERSTGRTWKLQIKKIDKASIRALGRNRFSGCVIFNDRGRSRQLDVDFVVDFSPGRWEVTSLRLHSVVAVKKAPSETKLARKRR